MTGLPQLGQRVRRGRGLDAPPPVPFPPSWREASRRNGSATTPMTRRISASMGAYPSVTVMSTGLWSAFSKPRLRPSTFSTVTLGETMKPSIT